MNTTKDEPTDFSIGSSCDPTFGNRLPELRDHFHDRCDCGLGLFNHNAVTAMVGKELLAVSR